MKPRAPHILEGTAVFRVFWQCNFCLIHAVNCPFLKLPKTVHCWVLGISFSYSSASAFNLPIHPYICYMRILLGITLVALLSCSLMPALVNFCATYTSFSFGQRNNKKVIRRASGPTACQIPNIFEILFSNGCEEACSTLSKFHYVFVV